MKSKFDCEQIAWKRKGEMRVSCLKVLNEIMKYEDGDAAIRELMEFLSEIG